VIPVPDLPAAPVDPFRTYVERGLANLAPVDVESEVDVAFGSLGGDNAVLVHAPGELVFAPRPEDRRLRGSFGFGDGAWSGGGGTDGAGFAVEAVFAGGARGTLWHRWLEPVGTPADRGRQDFELEIPAGVRLLLLRTSPGPAGRSDWDWTCWSRLQFSP
jgi:hypothetical protein